MCNVMYRIFIKKSYGFTFNYTSENEEVSGNFGLSSLVYEHFI